MADVIWEDDTAKAMMDAVTARVGSSGCLVMYEGVEGTDPTTIPAGDELVVINLAASPFAAAAITGSDPNATAHIVLATVSNATPSFTGTTKVAGSWALFKHQTTRSAANLICKGDVSTTLAASGSLLLDNTTLTNNGGAVNLDEPNCHLEMPLNRNY